MGKCIAASCSNDAEEGSSYCQSCSDDLDLGTPETRIIGNVDAIVEESVDFEDIDVVDDCIDLDDS